LRAKSLFALTVPIAVAVIFRPAEVLGQPSPALMEARRHMLDPEINSITFHSMAELFDTLDVATAGQRTRIESVSAPLDFTYTFDG
jgi:hypothetical protein